MKKLLSFLLAFMVAAPSLPAQDASYLPGITRFTLKNGLQVILMRDTTMPVVSVNIAYHAGSAFDPKGKSGLANLSGNLFLTGISPAAYTQLTRMEHAGTITYAGLTTVDWTNITSTFPMQYLETALWIESDRLRYARDILTADAVTAAKQSITTRISQAAAQPMAGVQRMIFEQLYPEGYPYRLVSIGDTTDIKRLTLGDVRRFLEMYLVPANASLTIGGDFEPSAAKAMVEKYFGSLPGGKRARWDREKYSLPELGTPVAVVQDRTDYNTLYIVFPTVRVGDPDEPVLQEISVLLTGGAEARLRTRLAGVNPYVLAANAYQNAQELDGNFYIVITCRPEGNLQQVYAQVMNILGAMKTDLVSDDELLAARNQLEMLFFTSQEKLDGFGGRCDAVNLRNVYTGNPLSAYEELTRLPSVTSEAVQSAMRKYFTDNHLVLSVVAPGRKSLAATGK